MTDLLCITDVQSSLTSALQSNDIQRFRFALQNGADASLLDGNMSVFELACQTPGRGQFIEECIQMQHCDVLNENSKTGKYPIHSTITSLDVSNLRTLLAYSPKEQINLRYQKRTALYLLTENLKADNADQVFECIKVLVENGADFNIPNENDFTPIVRILMAKIPEEAREKLVNYCFKNTNIDVDTFRDGKARQLMEKKYKNFNIPDFKVMPNFEVLQSFLDNGEKDRFEVAFPFYVQKIHADKKIDTFLAKEFSKLLDSAIEKGFDGCFDQIIVKNPDLKSNEISKLMMKACQFGRSIILKKLLSLIDDNNLAAVNEEALLCKIVKNIKSTESGAKCPYYECFKVLMADNRVNVDKIDDIGCTALHYAVQYKLDDVITALLKAQSFIGTKNMFSKLAIHEIDPDVLEKYLDSCITTNGKRSGDDEFQIKINFSCLIPPKYKENCENDKKYENLDEILPIVHISQSNELKHLLKHPVIWSFIFIKWSQLSLFFYANLAMCSVFFSAIVVYLTNFYGNENINSEWGKILWSIQLLGVIYLLTRELLQLTMSPGKYFTLVSNWMELTLIVLLLSVTFYDKFSMDTKAILSALIILLIGFEYVILIGSLPFLTISTHIAMLRTVSYNFLHSLLFYSIGLISFALAFHILFRVNAVKAENKDDSEFNSFTNPFISILKTFVMLTGEFEAADIKVDVSITMCIIFGLFVFFVPIVISNLINGLAVNDTQIIKSQAELVGLQQRVEVLQKYQQSTWIKELENRLFSCCTKRSSTTLPAKEVTIYPNNYNKYFLKMVRPVLMNKEDVENGISLQQKSKILIEFDDQETNIECCACKTCSPMEVKVVKYAKERLNSQTQENPNMEIGMLKRKIIEQDAKLDELVKLLKIALQKDY